jgi:hypothetical protein
VAEKLMPVVLTEIFLGIQTFTELRSPVYPVLTAAKKQ